MARDEHPLRRVNPSGKVRWVARWTDRAGNRHSGGTYALRGPCKKPMEDGDCCAQHRINHLYELDRRKKVGGKTVGQFAETWLYRFPRAERTAVNYEQRLRILLPIEVDGRKVRDWPLSEVRRSHIGAIVDVLLREQGRAAKGAKGILLVFSALFSDAITDDLVEFNPCLGYRVRGSDPRVQKRPRQKNILDWPELHAFAKAAGNYEPMVRVLSDCGLRLGELFPLERADLKLNEGPCDEPGCPMRIPHLHVRKKAWRQKVEDGTKNTRDDTLRERVVPLGDGVRALLAAIPPRIDTTLLFPDPHGNVWGDRRFYDLVWYPARERSGLETLTPHDMRHSWVSLLRYAGVDPRALALVAGHTESTATAIYTHVIPARAKESAEKMIAVLEAHS